MPIVLKSGSLKLLEPSGPVQVCNGIALPLHRCYVADARNLMEYDISTEAFRLMLRTSLINLVLVRTGNRL